MVNVNLATRRAESFFLERFPDDKENRVNAMFFISHLLPPLLTDNCGEHRFPLLANTLAPHHSNPDPSSVLL